MREIKFRAWDKKDRVMLFTEKFNDSKVHLVHYFNGTVGIARDFEDVLGGDPEVELMQFTGLKDKHGVEIYEGDIVQVYKHMSQEKGKVYLVQWSEETCEYNGIFPSIAVWVAHEVIGNIYENPELLADQPPMIGEPAHPTGEGAE